MFKKKIKLLLLICLFSVFITNIYAYEYYDNKNKSEVNHLINETYDRVEMYEFLAGEPSEEDELEFVEANNDSYWWPIGSTETTSTGGKTFATSTPEKTVITSQFGNRIHPISGGASFHSGVDIANSTGSGVTNVIASKDGIVVYPTKNSQTNCASSGGASSCGGGYGNYVVIQHSDGNYTLYAHLYENSITVTEGESVKQGQVIGKMGTSGNSTGTHLHFEIRVGQNASSSAVNPLEHISMENPRPAGASNKFLSWLHSWEGNEGIDGDSYIIANIGDGVRTVGYGVTLESNASRFKKYGIDVSKYGVGDKLPIDIVDKVEAEEIESAKNNINATLVKNEVVLKNNQIEALISFEYNIGNIGGFVDNYKAYGDTDKLYENYFSHYVHVNGAVWQGLVNRRKSEWSMFHNNEYICNGTCKS